jgi:hypothetical protein
MPIPDAVGIVEEKALLPWVIVKPFDRQLKIFSSVGDGFEQVHRAHRDERQIGRVGGYFQSGGLPHLADLQSAVDASHIHHIELQDIDGFVLEHQLP